MNFKDVSDQNLDALWFNLVSEKISRLSEEKMYFSQRWKLAEALDELLRTRVAGFNREAA